MHRIASVHAQRFLLEIRREAIYPKALGLGLGVIYFHFEAFRGVRSSN